MLFRSLVIKAGAITVGLGALLATIVIAGQGARYSSKYVNPAVFGGLFYIVSSPEKYDVRALVLSYDDKPIRPKANDPGAPTVPGFYPSFEERFDFERVEVIRRKIYFKTRSVGGVTYEFSGTSGEAAFPDFDPSIRVPFIQGTLTKLRNGKVIKRERVKFGHAVIASKGPAVAPSSSYF